MDSPTKATAPPWTVARLLSWTTDFLRGNGVEEPRLSCELLLARATGFKRIELYTRFDEVLTPDVLAAFRDLIQRATDSEPIAYLVGEKEFFSLAFTVTSDVLIPRGETETLVEVVLDECAQKERDSVRILDLGTGSGCVAIAILSQLADARGVATDISPEALEVARKNADRHGLSERLSLVQTDRLKGIDAGDGFDWIVSNPPYIPADQIEQLDANVREFEPRIALTDDGDGLSFYRSIAQEAADLLRGGPVGGGRVAVEIADGLASIVEAVFQAAGGWTHTATIQDRVVGKDRVLVFQPTAC